jgi:translation initiation factor IF-3
MARELELDWVEIVAKATRPLPDHELWQVPLPEKQAAHEAKHQKRIQVKKSSSVKIDEHDYNFRRTTWSAS